MIGEGINGSTTSQLRRRLLRHQLDWSPWFDQELCPVFGSPCPDEGLHQTSTPISIKITEESSMELGGSTSTLPSGDRRCFFGQRTCIRRHRLLKCRFNDCFGGIVRNWVYNNPGKFRQVPMEESLAIRDIPEPCQIWTRIWTSVGRGLQSPARRSFGRSNRSSTV